jgi:hypothetical protein
MKKWGSVHSDRRTDRLIELIYMMLARRIHKPTTKKLKQNDKRPKNSTALPKRRVALFHLSLFPGA